jgi:uncharacterized protein YodC (DUF2158 family)
MAEEKIEQGDIVWLKSGGPAMTVNGYSGDHNSCSWFINNIAHSELFIDAALTKTEPTIIPAVG